MTTLFDRISGLSQFQPPENWFKVQTVDMHTGGEPLRVILNGFPVGTQPSVLDYRKALQQDKHDQMRRMLMLEPRGHADMYGCLLLPPNPSTIAGQTEEEIADFGIVFMHNDGYSSMCGHAIIAVTRLAVDMKWIAAEPGKHRLLIDAPCGRITSFAMVEDGQCTGTSFRCVPSFVVGLDRKVHVNGLGEVNYDLAFGGAFYAYVDLRKNDLPCDLSPDSYLQLIRLGTDIKHCVANQDREIRHPFEDDLSFLYGIIFVDDSPTSGVHSRNVCVFADGEVDRSPTGSGVSGRMAIHRAREEVFIGDKITIESIIGSRFDVGIHSEVEFGQYHAVVPEVSGSAYITGIHTFVVDPQDPLQNGFKLR